MACVSSCFGSVPLQEASNTTRIPKHKKLRIFSLFFILSSRWGNDIDNHKVVSDVAANYCAKISRFFPPLFLFLSSAFPSFIANKHGEAAQ
jgi:hypothetical protein